MRSRDDALDKLADSRLAEVGTTDLRELGDVHGAVAAAAARLAAARASAPEISRLRDLVSGVAMAESVSAQRRIDGRWYIEVAACAQSVRLTMQEMDLHVELASCRGHRRIHRGCSTPSSTTTMLWSTPSRHGTPREPVP